MTTTEQATVSGETSRRARNMTLLLLGPVVAVSLFLLTIALLYGIPPVPAPPRPRWADTVISLLGIGIPFVAGVAISARGAAGLWRRRPWVAAAIAVPVVIVGIVMISLILWRLGWPVLVTGYAGTG